MCSIRFFIRFSLTSTIRVTLILSRRKFLKSQIILLVNATITHPQMLIALESYYWRYCSASELVNMILAFIETR